MKKCLWIFNSNLCLTVTNFFLTFSSILLKAHNETWKPVLISVKHTAGRFLSDPHFFASKKYLIFFLYCRHILYVPFLGEWPKFPKLLSTFFLLHCRRLTWRANAGGLVVVRCSAYGPAARSTAPSPAPARGSPVTWPATAAASPSAASWTPVASASPVRWAFFELRTYYKSMRN